MGTTLGSAEGRYDGTADGEYVGENVGAKDGANVGGKFGAAVGALDGVTDGLCVLAGFVVGVRVGANELIAITPFIVLYMLQTLVLVAARSHPPV